MDSINNSTNQNEKKGRSVFDFWKKRTKNAADSRVNADFDKKLVYSLSKSRIPSVKQFKYIKKFLSKTELAVIRISLVLIVASFLFLSGKFVMANLETVPAAGGSYSEGLVGYPKNINPLYSNISDVDSDIAYLIYSSLFKRGANSELVNDLVEEYGISEDGKVYTFKIRSNAKWHDGAELTVDDIIFTFSAIQEQAFKSTLRQSFTGVAAEKTDENSFKLVLNEPYAAFLDLLVFGILPGELWSQIPPDTATLAELNIKPIGSGPYKFKSLAKDKSGAIKTYTLEANEDYYGQKPNIQNLTFTFFASAAEAVESLNRGEIEGVAYLPKDDEANIKNIRPYNLHRLSLPQLTAVFFNLKAANLADKKVRQALSLSIGKNETISQAAISDAERVDGPILPDSFAYNPEIKKYELNLEEAGKLLDEAGWKTAEITAEMIANAQAALEKEENVDENRKLIEQGEGKWRQKDGRYLSIKLASVDRVENAVLADALKSQWAAAGVKIVPEFHPVSVIQNEVIKSRNFEMLLYGQIVGGDPDLYAFWHSSQAAYPGLNITGYSDKEADKMLEEARTTNDKAARQERYKIFQTKIAEEAPAIFLFSKRYTYLQNKKISGFAVTNISLPYDRFNNISDWYVKTEKKLSL